MVNTNRPASTPTPIARTELIGLCQGGKTIALIVEIGQPFQAPDGLWQTPVALHGLDGPLPEITGEDSLQSLLLAADTVQRRLVSFVKDGDRLVGQDGAEFPLSAYLPRTQDPAGRATQNSQESTANAEGSTTVFDRSQAASAIAHPAFGQGKVKDTAYRPGWGDEQPDHGCFERDVGYDLI